MRGGGSKERAPPGAREVEIRRRKCEDFAPRNGAARVCGEWGANRASKKPAGPEWRRGNCVKILLPGTELQGFAGSGEQTSPRKSRPAPSGGAGSKLKGSEFRRCAESTPFISYFFSSSGFFSVGSVSKFKSKSVC